MITETQIEALVGKLAPADGLIDWLITDDYANARFYRSITRPLVVIFEVAEYEGRPWLHVSVSARGRLPTWEELRDVKDTFIGRDRLAVQIFPPQDEYVNIHPNVLHLWCVLDGPRLTPDFRRGGGI